MAKCVPLDRVYFGIKLFDDAQDFPETVNLFEIPKVKWSVARYVAMDEMSRKEFAKDPLAFCFFELCGASGYEYLIQPVLGDKKECKISVYDLYIKPNEHLLMKIVNSISVNSARDFLREERKRYRENKV